MGTTPYVTVPTKGKRSLSLLMAISRNKSPYYQLFEGGLKSVDFLGFMTNLI